MKTFLYLMGTLFALFAYFQLNDATQFNTADPAVIAWVLAYGFTSLSTFLAAAGKPLPRSTHLCAALLALGIAFIRATEIDWSHSLIFCHECNPAANETGGLLILTTWHLFLYLKVLKKKPAPKNPATSDPADA